MDPITLALAKKYANRDQIRIASDYPGATGGEKIQAAIDDLPDSGGLVYIPAEGPDSVLNSENEMEAGVWAVDTPITTRGKRAVRIEGASPGWVVPQTGTRLIATAEIPAMLIVNGGFLDSVAYLRLDGANKADVCLQLGDSHQRNDFQAIQVMAHSATEYGILLNGRRNFWLDRCWTELCGIAGVGIDIGNDSVWIQNHLTWANGNAVRVIGPAKKVWITNLRSDEETHDGISVAAPVAESWIQNCHLRGAGQANVGGYSGIRIGAPVTSLKISGVTIDGEDVTGSGLSKDDATELYDCVVENVSVKGVTKASFLGFGPGSSLNGRTVINGMGYNAGDPNVEGDWSQLRVGPGFTNDRELEGRIVYDRINKKLYMRAADTWILIGP